jgi:mannose-6-phosphate isomerase-like protein (cupin superfamily)
MSETTSTEGYSVAHLDDLGEGPGFRKVRTALGVESMGANVIVLPAAYETKYHFHDRQEEIYFVHTGEIEIEFGDGTVHRLRPGGIARVAPLTHRRLRNVGSGEATLFCVGAADGYVGRDGNPGGPSA